jgi:hypothetical protein
VCGTGRQRRSRASPGEVLSMRAKKRLAATASSMLLEVAGYTAMGAAFGLGFAFALTHIVQLGVVAYIDHSYSPQDAMMSLVGTCVATFSIGVTMTGLVFSKLKALE